MLCLGLFASCSDTQDSTTEVLNTTTTTGHVLRGSFSFDGNILGETDSTQTRTYATYSSTGGMRYQWTMGAKLPIHFYAEQNGRTDTFSVVASITNTQVLNFDVNLPEHLDPSKGTLRVAAALGKQEGVSNGTWCTGFDLRGNAIFYSNPVIDVADAANINVPLYMPLTTVEKTGTINFNLQTWGTWFQIYVNGNRTTNFDRFVLKSDALSTYGSLNLSKNSSTPTWISIGNRSGISEYELKNMELGSTSNSEKFFIWAMPTTNVNDPSLAPTLVTLSNTTTGAVYGASTGKPFNFAPGKSYHFTVTLPAPEMSGALMITEYGSHPKTDGNTHNWIEITNTTGRTISLSGYYLVRAVAGAPYTPAGVLDLGTLAQQSSVTVLNSANSTTSLPAGASLIITGSAVNKGTSGYFMPSNPGYRYQAIMLGENANLLKQFQPTRHTDGNLYNAYFLTYGGTDISQGNFNNIVDNFGRNSNGGINKIAYMRSYLRRPYYYVTLGNNGIHTYKGAIGYAGAVKEPSKHYTLNQWTYVGRLVPGDMGYVGRTGITTTSFPTIPSEFK